MERNFTGLIVHLCDINNDLIMSDPMYPLIPGICLLSEARYFKVIAMILLNLSCTISDMPPPELMPLFLHKTTTCGVFIDSRTYGKQTDKESWDCMSVSLAGNTSYAKENKSE